MCLFSFARFHFHINLAFFYARLMVLLFRCNGFAHFNFDAFQSSLNDLGISILRANEHPVPAVTFHNCKYLIRFCMFSHCMEMHNFMNLLEGCVYMAFMEPVIHIKLGFQNPVFVNVLAFLLNSCLLMVDNSILNLKL